MAAEWPNPNATPASDPTTRARAKDPQALPAHLDPTDSQETVDPPVSPDLWDKSWTDPQSLARPARWDPLARQDPMDSPEDPERLVAPDPKDSPERTVPQAHPETPVPPEVPDSPEEPVVRELATTAHPHAQPPAIKRQKRWGRANGEKERKKFNNKTWQQIFNKEYLFLSEKIVFPNVFKGFHLFASLSAFFYFYIQGISKIFFYE
jgi:hypothetical protein